MGLKRLLEKMKLVELEAGEAPPVAATAPAPAARAAEPVDLEAILGSLPPAPAIDEAKLPAAAANEAIEVPDFDAIYRAAGIAEPAHGFSAGKILEILEAPEFAGLEPKAKAAALAGFLKMVPGGPVPIADVIQDAVRRDQALDRFAAFLSDKLAARRAAVERQNAELRAEIDQLIARRQQTLAANLARLDADRERLAAWERLRRAEEERLAAAVAPFVESNPVSITPAADKPPAA